MITRDSGLNQLLSKAFRILQEMGGDVPRQVIAQELNVSKRLMDEVQVTLLDRGLISLKEVMVDGHSKARLYWVQKAEAPGDFTPSTVSFADIHPEKVEWLWYPYFPRGKISLAVGDPGCLKTFVMLEIASIVSQGRPFPDPDSGSLPARNREPQNVVYLSAEDGLADTLRPRLDAAGADVSRIFTSEERVSIQDIDVIKQILDRHRPALLVIDPVQGFLPGDANMNSANEIRAVLSPLANLATEFCCSVILVGHLNKQTKTSRAIYRFLGSIDFIATARSALIFGKDPDEDGSYLMAHTKASLAVQGPTFKYRLDNGAIRWAGRSDALADDLLRSDSKPTRKDQAKGWLQSLLAKGPLPSTEVKTLAEKEGHSRSTLDRAKAELRIVSVAVRSDDGKTILYWAWQLPSTAAAHRQIRLIPPDEGAHRLQKDFV